MNSAQRRADVLLVRPRVAGDHLRVDELSSRWHGAARRPWRRPGAMSRASSNAGRYVRGRVANLRNSWTRSPYVSTAVFDRAVRAAPARRCRERCPAAGFGRRPVLEHDRLGRGDPIETAGRYQAVGPADVLADRDEGVVAAEDVGEPELPPHLAEPGVDVEEHPPPRRREHVRVGQEPHDVKQESDR